MNNNNYWDDRYKRGGSSGSGSIGSLKHWKWQIIYKYLEHPDDIVDVGCGDLSFWKGRDCKKYTGIDISPHIVKLNKKKRPHWNFISSPAHVHQKNVSGKIIFCFDLLFHVLDDQEFLAILKNLTSYSKEWIFIYTWIKNPFYSWGWRLFWLKTMQIRMLARSLTHRLITDNEYQKFRNLISYTPVFKHKGFQLLSIEREKSITEFGALFIFHKEP